MTSYAVGSALYTALQSGPVNVTFNVQTTTEEVPQYNLIADTKQGDPERTIVVGAHLDSVEEGPGINDNGSGTRTLIEMAEQIAQAARRSRATASGSRSGARRRPAWSAPRRTWPDLIESGEIDDIEANLNFDMLASPNFVRFVYDGDNSTGEGDVGPPGSAEIEQVFLRYFASQGLATDPTAFDGRSDYGPFIAPEALVPAGGLFSGAEGVKTDAQAAVYGGAAGFWYDPCYHQACDTFSTVLGVAAVPGRHGLESAEDAELMRGNGPIGLGSSPTARLTPRGRWRARRARWSVLPRYGAHAPRPTKRARRAAKHREFRGPIGIR